MEEHFNSHVESQFFEYLLKRGYSRDSIMFEPYLGNKFQPDFAINDPGSAQRLAYFEVRGSLYQVRGEKYLKRLKAYSAEARAINTPFYIVIPSDNPTETEPFDFLFVNEQGDFETLPKELFPTFRSLSSDVIATQKVDVKVLREKTKDAFQVVCWTLAGSAILLVIVDFFCDLYRIELIDSTRLTLLGVIVALIVIPFSQKFKFLGVEYERLNKTQSETSKS